MSLAASRTMALLRLANASPSLAVGGGGAKAVMAGILDRTAATTGTLMRSTTTSSYQDQNVCVAPTPTRDDMRPRTSFQDALLSYYETLKKKKSLPVHEPGTSAPVAAAAVALVESSHYNRWLVRGMEMLGASSSNVGIWLSSTLKKRKTKMNKHKLRKRRKKERLKSK
mmetsp:Transcript_6968/g.14625  ORF Transcript_6968/g.14625 Transcript_6968/m.14625 type:complete len:169 (-) Transcript_6968:163-669(-)